MLKSKFNTRKIINFWLIPFFAGGFLSSGYLITHKAILFINQSNLSTIKAKSKQDGSRPKATKNLASSIKEEVDPLKESEMSKKDHFTQQEKNFKANAMKFKIQDPKSNDQQTPKKALITSTVNNPATKTSKINSTKKDSAQNPIPQPSKIQNPIQSKILFNKHSPSSEIEESIFTKLFRSLPEP